MKSGPENVTTTTTSEPPAFLLPGLQTGVNAAINDFNAGPAFGNFTSQGIGNLFNRGTEGSPVTGAAQDLATSTLRGDFLSPDSNPFLQDTFNRAADLTRTRLSSEFGGQGRNVGAALPARSNELQGLATGIFGGNFQNERNRQLATSAQAPQLANADFTDIGAQIDAGQFVDSLDDRNIDQLISRITGTAGSAGGTTTGQQPVFNNTGAGILGGAATGAGIGNIFGPLGAGVGAGLGGLLGGFF